MLTLYGVAALTFMMLMYALEHRGPRFVFAFACGCVLSSAVAAHVALGFPLPKAVEAAKAFVGRAIEAGRGLRLGAGVGPLLAV